MASAGALRPPLSWASRLAWGACILFPSIVFAIATRLSPAASGVGTHTQLGLPPCGFLAWTGLPCPGCGLTTCFAHMVRGELGGALQANVFGVGFFLVTALGVPFSVWALATRRPLMDTLVDWHMEKVLLGLSILGIVSWGVRIALILTHGSAVL